MSVAQLNDEQVVELKDYLLHRERKLDGDLLPYGDPAGKDLLVFGSGIGNEILWAARHGARSVVAVDLYDVNPAPLRLAMEEEGIEFSAYEFREQNIHDTALTGEQYDLIVSNGVFEHVFDLKGVLGAFRPLLRPGGRVAIFADSLWYSSLGGHINREPWEHLWRSTPELKEVLPPKRWRVMCDQLNRMTVVDFIEAVRSVGMLIMQMKIGRDPNLRHLPALLPAIQERSVVTPTDLSAVSIGCELCFVEHL
ncbi:MAG TPA: class I SAM-dependent methyltransferase [Solirubrobacteraceae bacterium]